MRGGWRRDRIVTGEERWYHKLSLKGTRRDELWQWCREFHAWLATTRKYRWGLEAIGKRANRWWSLGALTRTEQSPSRQKNRVLIIGWANGTFTVNTKNFFPPCFLLPIRARLNADPWNTGQGKLGRSYLFSLYCIINACDSIVSLNLSPLFRINS